MVRSMKHFCTLGHHLLLILSSKAQRRPFTAGILTIAVNHFKSKLGGDAPEARRQMQGKFLGEWLEDRSKDRKQGASVVLGDLNASYGEGAYELISCRADGSRRFFDAPLLLDPSGSLQLYLQRAKKCVRSYNGRCCQTRCYFIYKNPSS